MNARSYLFALLVGTTAASATLADNPFDKFIPRGRLLRKLRDDIIGPSEPTPAQAEAAANRKGPTPAVRPGSGQPAPARRPPQQFQHPASKTAQPQRSKSTDGALTAERSRTANARPQTGSQVGLSKNVRVGFGMAVEADRNDRLVITQIAPGSNAAEAGLLRGDVILAAGGVDLSSIEEYREITKILGAGDQLDFKIARRGREATLSLQHGQPPELPELDQMDDAPRGPSDRLSPVSAKRQRSVTPRRSGGTYQGDFEFVPPTDEHSANGMRSVLDSPITQEPAPALVRTHVPARPVSMSGAMNQMRSQPRPQQPPRQLQPTIAQQQQQIRELEQRLQLLQRQQGVTGSGLRTRGFSNR